MAEQEQEYPGYPKFHDKCPSCESTERESESMVNEEKKKGRVKKDTSGPLMRQITGVAIPNPLNVPNFKVPGLIADLDICSNCGLLYATMVERKLVIPPPTMQFKMAPGARPPGLPPQVPGVGG